MVQELLSVDIQIPNPEYIVHSFYLVAVFQCQFEIPPNGESAYLYNVLQSSIDISYISGTEVNENFLSFKVDYKN